MGAVLEVTRSPLPSLALMLVLAACGSDRPEGGLTPGAVLGQVAPRAPAPAAAPAKVDPALVAEGRKLLEAGGKPILSVADPSIGFASLMTPIGENGTVTTWANPEYQTLGLRDGVLLATRGLPDDLMSAKAPTAAELARGMGRHQRVHYVLDGADQSRALTFDCTLAVSEPETIEILGRPYATRVVEETCEGPAGRIENRYWLDASGVIRQSHQMRAPGRKALVLQAVVD
jgi:hypothetical protein